MRRLPSRFEVDQPPDVLPRPSSRRLALSSHVIDSLFSLHQPRDHRGNQAALAPSRSIQKRHLVISVVLVVSLNVLVNIGAYFFVRRHQTILSDYRNACLDEIICKETQRQVSELRLDGLLPLNALPSIRASAAGRKQSAIHMVRSSRPPVRTGNQMAIQWDVYNTMFNNSDIGYDKGILTVKNGGVYLIYSRIEFVAGPPNSTFFQHELHRVAFTGHLLRRVAENRCPAHRRHANAGDEEPCYVSLIVSTLWLPSNTGLYVTAEPTESLGKTKNNFFGLVHLDPKIHRL